MSERPYPSTSSTGVGSYGRKQASDDSLRGGALTLPSGLIEIVQSELERIRREHDLMWRFSPEGHLVMTSAAGVDVTQSLGVLAEACRDTPRGLWPERVRHVLQVLVVVTTGATDAEKVMQDYRQAGLRLKVQIYPEGRLAAVPREMYVARRIGPGLLAVLVLDLPGALMMVPGAQAVAWGQTRDALYAVALLNSWAGVRVTCSAHELATGLMVQSLQTGSAFTATQVTALEHHLGEPAPLGALVIIPTVHVLVFHVIKDAQARAAVASLASMALNLSLPRPLVVSPFVYWWRAGLPLTPLTEIEGTRYRIALPGDWLAS
jgi:hypothetical protein